MNEYDRSLEIDEILNQYAGNVDELERVWMWKHLVVLTNRIHNEAKTEGLKEGKDMMFDGAMQFMANKS